MCSVFQHWTIIVHFFALSGVNVVADDCMFICDRYYETLREKLSLYEKFCVSLELQLEKK